MIIIALERVVRDERNININITGITKKDAAADCGARDRSSATSVVECRPRPAGYE